MLCIYCIPAYVLYISLCFIHKKSDFPPQEPILPRGDDITSIETAHPKETEDVSALTKPTF